MSKCKHCGGPTVAGLDRARTCPECKRLFETVGSFGRGNQYDWPELRNSEGVLMEGSSRKGVR